MKKVLIIKFGWVEFLDDRLEHEQSVSLGDVFRTTTLLHLYKDDDVTWLTVPKAVPLLKRIKYINRIILFDLLSVLQLQSEYFDIVINLEKVAGICAFVDSIKFGIKYGFRLNPVTGEIAAYHGAEKVLQISKNDKMKKALNTKTYQEFLYEVVDKTWNKEEFILGYESKVKIKYDIGLNHHIGLKWPTKQWGSDNWKELENRLITHGYTVSRQQGLEDIEAYIDWLNSCRLIITHDSLGLHFALALKKKVIALHGPTYWSEVYMYDRGIKLTPTKERDCIPCMKAYCIHEETCIKDITVELVLVNVKKLLSSH